MVGSLGVKHFTEQRLKCARGEHLPPRVRDPRTRLRLRARHHRKLAPRGSVMKSRRFNPSPRPHAVPICPGADPNETGGVWERVSPEPRRPGIAAARGGFASNERDERLVAWLIFSRRFLGDFLEAWPRFSPCRPSIVNSPGAKRKMLVGRPATTQAIDHGSERRARPQ
jgi:hypothetical protein